MKKLVTLWRRPSRDDDGRFTYSLIYYDENNRRRQKSLGHADARRAERERAKWEQDLRMGNSEPSSLRLSEFLEQCLHRTQGLVRDTTLATYRTAMKEFISTVGDIDYRRVTLEHGESFVRACHVKKSSPATIRKKIVTLKRIFQLAVERDQIEGNPFARLRKPKAPEQEFHIFSDEECQRLLAVVKSAQADLLLRWDLLILATLCTGLRRGELLNLTWTDIDVDQRVIRVSPKKDTEQTWEWHIKDTDRRMLPLTDELLQLLSEHRAQQPKGYPYVFIPSSRYDTIQQLRKAGKWTVSKGATPLNNFNRQFRGLRKRAGIGTGEFHDLRRTCISKWFDNGLREFEVMSMAGHASFETTRRFYLAYQKVKLLSQTREASSRTLATVAKLLHSPSEADTKKKLAS